MHNYFSSFAVIYITGVTTLSMPRPPPVPTLSPVGVQGYRRFHANDSLIGQPVPCIPEEKTCFQFNMLYVESSQGIQCRSVSSSVVGDREEFLTGSGHLRGIHLSYIDPCASNHGYRMSYDGRCYKEDVVRSTICGCDGEPTFHLFSGRECQCTASLPIHVEQPQEEGRCRIPDFRSPINSSYFFQNPFEDIQGFKTNFFSTEVCKRFPQFACSAAQQECFSQGKVWLPEGNDCFPLLEKGPCAEEHVVALDARAAQKGRAEGTCVHVRGGCPQGHVRIAFDGQCHREILARSTPGTFHRNQFGIGVIASNGVSRVVFQPILLSGVEPRMENLCVVNIRLQFNEQAITPAIETVLNPSCGANDKSKCSRYEVLTDPPQPEFE